MFFLLKFSCKALCFSTFLSIIITSKNLIGFVTIEQLSDKTSINMILKYHRMLFLPCQHFGKLFVGSLLWSCLNPFWSFMRNGFIDSSAHCRRTKINKSLFCILYCNLVSLNVHKTKWRRDVNLNIQIHILVTIHEIYMRSVSEFRYNNNCNNILCCHCDLSKFSGSILAQLLFGDLYIWNKVFNFPHDFFCSFSGVSIFPKILDLFSVTLLSWNKT